MHPPGWKSRTAEALAWLAAELKLQSLAKCAHIEKNRMNACQSGGSGAGTEAGEWKVCASLRSAGLMMRRWTLDRHGLRLW
jgi:hypothetical protein